MKNIDIRTYAKQKSVMLWQIADKLGISDVSFSKKLRHELPEAEKERIRNIIDEVAAEREAAEHER